MNDGFIRFGDGPWIPATDIKMDITYDLGAPALDEGFEAWAPKVRKRTMLAARETEPGVWEVAG